MTANASPALIELTRRLKELEDRALATELLWLAAEGLVEITPEGALGVWSANESLLGLAEDIGEDIELAAPVSVDPTWTGPEEEEAVYLAVDPSDVVCVARRADRVEMDILAATPLVHVEAEKDELASLTRPQRKGPARLFPRLARRR